MAKKKPKIGLQPGSEEWYRIERLLLSPDWPEDGTDRQVERKLGINGGTHVRQVREYLTCRGRLHGEARSDHPARGYKPFALVRTGYAHDGKGGIVRVGQDGLPLVPSRPEPTSESTSDRLTREGLISTTEAGRILGRLRDGRGSGKGCDPGTIRRWMTEGVVLADGTAVTLESVQVAKCRMTSRAAVLRFVDLQQDPANRPVRSNNGRRNPPACRQANAGRATPAKPELATPARDADEWEQLYEELFLDELSKNTRVDPKHTPEPWPTDFLHCCG